MFESESSEDISCATMVSSTMMRSIEIRVVATGATNPQRLAGLWGYSPSVGSHRS